MERAHTYAVAWSGHDEDGTGRLDALADRFELHGRGRPLLIPFADVAAAAIGRSAAERLRGLPVLVLRLRAGGSLRIASLQGAGILLELLELVGAPA